MLSESHIKRAILHPVEEVRCAALRYFSDSYTDDTSLMPLVIQAVETLDRRSSFGLLRHAERLPQTPATIGWLVDQLSHDFELDDLDEDNHRFALALVLIAADPELLIGQARDVVELTAFPEQLRQPLAERLEMHAWSWDRCRDALEALGRETLEREAVTIADHRKLLRILDACARHRTDAEPYVLNVLRRQYRRHDRPLMEWMEPWIIDLAGRIRSERSIPLLLRRLEWDDSEIQDAIGNALTRIGGRVVIQTVAREWWRSGLEARSVLCEVLEHVHSDPAAERSRAFFAKETDPEPMLYLAHAILGQFDRAGIGPVRRYVLELDMDQPDNREVRDALVIVSLVLGEQFPEFDDWHRDAKESSWGWLHGCRARIAKSFRGVFLADPTVAYRIKVSLDDVDPPVWRRLEIPDCSLCDLHGIVQVAMGWEDSHLFAFTVGGDRYVDRMMVEDDPTCMSGALVHLSDLFVSAGKRFAYEYDFGDGWRHEVIIEEIIATMPSSPRCVGGARACPPEDVGGSHGYMHYLEALADPGHEEHEQCLQWRGAFDAEAFDLDRINQRLRSLQPCDQY